MPSDAWLVAVTEYVHRRLGNWDDVLAAFEKATQLDRRDAALFLDLGGHTLKSVRRYAEALRTYERAGDLAPDLHEASVRRAWTYVRWHGRLDSLRAALQSIPPDADLGLLGTTTQLVQMLHWEREAVSGLALAALARRDEALREARWLARSTVYREDAFFGPVLAEDRARILAQAGDAEAALDEIERLLGGPSFLTLHTLRLDPL